MAFEHSSNPPQDRQYFIRVRPGDSLSTFLKRTVAAQLHLGATFVWIFALLVLAHEAARYSLWQYVTAMLFGLCSIMLFASSALQHFLDDGFHISKRLIVILENIDKLSIYLVIASTYTAILYNALPNPLCWQVLGLVWTLAILGCLYTIFIERLPRWMQSRIVYTGQFVLLGWTILICVNDLKQSLSTLQITSIFVGGLFYSIGAVAYAFKRPNPTRYFGYHEIWHSAVICGSVTFYLLVMSFYLGLPG